MTTPNPTPHDSFAQEVFSDPEQAAVVLRAALPPVLTSALDFSKAKLLPSLFKDEELKERRADFLFEIPLAYSPEADEVAIVQQTTSTSSEPIRAVVTRQEILEFQQVVRRVPVADDVVRHAVQVVRATRPGDGAAEFVGKYLAYGASVRAAQALVLGGKARALLHGRSHVAYEDIQALARPVLRHRLLRTFQAQSERITTDDLVARVVAGVTPPRSGL